CKEELAMVTALGSTEPKTRPMRAPVQAVPEGGRSAPPTTGSDPTIQAEVVKLSQISPRRWLLAAGFDWGVVLAAIVLCQMFWSWPLFLASVAVIGARQYALLALVHDAAHYRALRNRTLNDQAANLL